MYEDHDRETVAQDGDSFVSEDTRSSAMSNGKISNNVMKDKCIDELKKQKKILDKYQNALANAESLLFKSSEELEYYRQALAGARADAERAMCTAESLKMKEIDFEKEFKAAQSAFDTMENEKKQYEIESQKELLYLKQTLEIKSLANKKSLLAKQEELDKALKEIKNKTLQTKNIISGYEAALKSKHKEYEESLQTVKKTVNVEIKKNIILKNTVEKQRKVTEKKQKFLIGMSEAKKMLKKRCIYLEKQKKNKILEIFRVSQNKLFEKDHKNASGSYGDEDYFKEKTNIIEQSLLFDAEWYQERANIKNSENQIIHYLKEGAVKGFDPNPLFSTSYYLNNNLDVLISGQNPLLHYCMCGCHEDRNPHPFFSTQYYLDLNADVAEMRINPLVHFLMYGGNEKRNPHPIFDLKWYVSTYSDVIISGMNPLIYFIRIGEGKGQSPSQYFDSVWYMKHYPDVIGSQYTPLVHFLLYGQYEGRCSSPLFDPLAYYEMYPDVASSGVPALEHFIRYGIAEGRQASPCKDK